MNRIVFAGESFSVLLAANVFRLRLIFDRSLEEPGGQLSLSFKVIGLHLLTDLSIQELMEGEGLQGIHYEFRPFVTNRKLTEHGRKAFELLALLDRWPNSFGDFLQKLSKDYAVKYR